jgi:hypothetical protein
MEEYRIGQPVSGDKLQAAEFTRGRVMRGDVMIGEFWVGELPNGQMFMLEVDKADETEAREMWKKACEQMRKSVV